MAHSLGVEVVAEGVDSDARAALLTRLGCDIGQGYLFGRPVPAERFPGPSHLYAPKAAAASSAELLH
jgi:EAL domain-containing protein (putative c-di-GMP-specific phosphodiesterase class I)